MQKSKTAQKGAGKQRPGTEQVSSTPSMQKGQAEKIQPPQEKEQVKQKQGQGKSGKK